MNLSQINNVILRLGFFWGQSTFHQGSLDAVTHIEKVLTELEDWDARHPATTVDTAMEKIERIEYIRIEEMARPQATSDTCGQIVLGTPQDIQYMLANVPNISKST